MFNSTITEDEALFCPADGSIMITGKLHIKKSLSFGFVLGNEKKVNL